MKLVLQSLYINASPLTARSRCVAAILLAWMVCLRTLPAAAQEEQQWMPGKTIDNSNGLLQNTVSGMYFDTQSGFLWLGTEAGLARYDGTGIRIYDQRNTPDITTSRFPNFVSVLHTGVLGVDRSGGLYRISGNTVTRFSPSVTISQVLVSNFNFRGNLANLQRTQQLLDNSVASKGGYEKLADLVHNPMPMLWFDNLHWLSYAGSAFRFFSDSILIHEWPKRPGEKPVLIQQGSTVFALNNNGSGYLINTVDKTCMPFESTDAAFAGNRATIYYDRANNQPLVLNGNKLYRLFFTSDHFNSEYIGSLPQLPENITGILIHPSQKTIFVSTLLNGLFTYNKSIFYVYRTDARQPGADGTQRSLNNNYGAVLIDSRHVFTNNGVVFDLENGRSEHFSNQLEAQFNILKDHTGAIWYARGNRLLRMRVQGGPPQAAADILIPSLRGDNIQNYMVSLFEDASGKIWVSTGHFLGYVHQQQLVPFIIVKPDQLPSHQFSTLANGKIAAISEEGLVYLDTVHRALVPDPVIRQRNMRSYYTDQDGYTWITTYGNGNYLYYPKARRLFYLPSDRNGYLQFSHCMAEDGQGNFLVPTNRGLFRINRQHLLQMAGRPSGLFYQYFDARAGLVTNEFNGGCEPAFTALPDGDLLFPSLDGLVRVHTRLLPTPRSYPLFIDRVETPEGKSYPAVAGMHFAAAERNLVWYVAFGQWEQNYSPGFAYRLDNDTNWIAVPDGDRAVRLNELSGGKHTLYIRFQSGFTAGSMSGYQIEFTVGYRYYEQAWFWILVIVALGALTYLGIKLQTLRLKRSNIKLEKLVAEKTNELSQKNSELTETLSDLEETVAELNNVLHDVQESNIFKSRLIGMIGHDVLIPLRYISKVANQVQQHYGKLSQETTLESIAEIGSAAAQLQFFSESIHHWIRLQNREQIPVPEPIDIYSLVNELLQFQAALYENKQNKVLNEIPPGLSFFQDNMVVKVILANLLLSANRFTSNGTIRVHATKKGNLLILQITDTGKPMSAERASSLSRLEPIRSSIGSTMESGWGMGYILVTDLVRFTKGSLRVETGESSGNFVTVELPEHVETDTIAAEEESDKPTDEPV